VAGIRADILLSERCSMQTWEYVSVFIQLDEKKQIFYARLPGTNRRIEGIDNILIEYGEHGWELVSFSPDTYAGSTEPGSMRAFLGSKLIGVSSYQIGMEAIAYFAVFKRPRS
jgi:hypothetical protein